MIKMIIFVHILFLCFLTRITDSACSGPGSDPGFSNNILPVVFRVSPTSVIVQWTKSHLENIQCGDNFIVKYWPTGEPRKYKISNLLPLKVNNQDIVTKTFTYIKNNETFSYLIEGLNIHISYSIQVAVTEDRAIIGRSWYRSHPVIIPQIYYKSVEAKEEDIDEFMLIFLAIILILAILLIVVGISYNIWKRIIDQKRDYDIDDDYEGLQGIDVDIEPHIHFSNLNGNAFFPANKSVPKENTTKNDIDRQNLHTQDVGSELPFKEIDVGRQVSSQSCKLSDNYKNSMATVYLLKNGKLIRKAATRHSQLPSRTFGEGNRTTGQAGKGGLTAKRSGGMSKRKNVKLSYKKDRLGARKGALSCRAIRKPAARLMAQGVILSN